MATTVAASTALTRLLTSRARSARLLGACTSAIYLRVDAERDEREDVVAVVARGAVQLPVALVVGGALPVVGPGDKAVVGDGGVWLGSVHLRPVRWFDPRPHLRRLFDDVLVANEWETLTRVPELREAGLDPVHGDDVARSLVCGDASIACAHIGRGPGLTPAGDDLVAGVLAVLALMDLLDRACAAEVLGGATSATTALSAALLRCAADGQVIPQASAVLHALGGRGDPVIALEDLLRVGSTSGAALALGLLSGVRATAARRLDKEDHP